MFQRAWNVQLAMNEKAKVIALNHGLTYSVERKNEKLSGFSHIYQYIDSL